MSAALHEVEAPRRADVALDHIHAQRQRWRKEHRRPSALTAREALLALQFEALLVWTAAANIRAGVILTDDDFSRLTITCSRIDSITVEML